MKRAFLVLAMILSSNAARAECTADAGGDELRACLAQDLRDSDKRINAVYKLLMNSQDAAGKDALRNRQRAWLKQRDKACLLDNKESDREKWLQSIMADQAKTVCVIRYTFDRVAQLDAQVKTDNPAAPELPSAPKAPVFSSSADAASIPAGLKVLDNGYEIDSLRNHQTGKWYLEIWIDRAAIAVLGDALITPGISRSSGGGGVVHMINIRRSYISAAPLAIGMAVDLDNGYYYSRSNGIWKATPGSIDGMQLKLNNSYMLQFTGSTMIAELVKRGLIRINLGEKPFEYSMPDGYRPFAE